MKADTARLSYLNCFTSNSSSLSYDLTVCIMAGYSSIFALGHLYMSIL